MHPVAFHIRSFSIYWYGVMIAVAFLVGLWTASRRGLLHGVPPEKVLDSGPWLIIGTLVGARALHVITYWQEGFAGKPWWEVFMIRHGGMVYYGGLIGASLAFILYARFKKVPLWRMADVLAPSIALGYVFGRIGCLLNGCCFGKACDLPWAITYPVGHETHPPGQPAVPVHPSQVYDSLLNLVLYAALAWLYRRKKFDGQIFAAYLLGFAVTRTIAETFRGDYSDLHIHKGLTPAQWISIGIFTAGAVLYAWHRRSAQQRA
ncbi:MAG TPA: prolipoprotein diacylglyceryl transferase [Verrucomicrobia bacterium]|nr:prolipoprotein diacylglyceryl transferase [Verrucomicrobiota bacterium]HOB31632.1 prolipoprotein diacylglyceryl transferase [Verrucomicrobiota bacterium]HOP96411.1 prolipoprotein diacylglyceryl transferase [Verrucomicrobiota bacterium]HPU55837.1 prolipoprotein diacylglyceryl transferase [Verrucomicrobiota bacterium]